MRNLIAVLLVAPAPIVGILAMHPEWELGRAGEITFMLGKVWMLLVPLIWRLAVDRHKLRVSHAKRGGFGPAALTGLAISVAILLAYFLIGSRLIDYEAAREVAAKAGLDRPLRYVGLCLYWILVNSLIEEYVYRWFFLEKTRSLGAWGSAITSSALFTVHHVIALKFQFDWIITIIGSSGVFLGGMMWCAFARRYKSIWPAYLSHAIVDVAVFVVGALVIYG